MILVFHFSILLFVGVSPLEYIMASNIFFLTDAIAKEVPHLIKSIYIFKYQIFKIFIEEEHPSLLIIFRYITVILYLQT